MAIDEDFAESHVSCEGARTLCDLFDGVD